MCSTQWPNFGVYLELKSFFFPSTDLVMAGTWDGNMEMGWGWGDKECNWHLLSWEGLLLLHLPKLRPPLCRGKSEEKGQDTERVLLAVVRGDTLGAWQAFMGRASFLENVSLSPSHPSSRYSGSKPTWNTNILLLVGQRIAVSLSQSLPLL